MVNCPLIDTYVALTPLKKDVSTSVSVFETDTDTCNYVYDKRLIKLFAQPDP